MSDTRPVTGITSSPFNALAFISDTAGVDDGPASINTNLQAPTIADQKARAAGKHVPERLGEPRKNLHPRGSRRPRSGDGRHRDLGIDVVACNRALGSAGVDVARVG
jgi:hypothetical protein